MGLLHYIDNEVPWSAGNPPTHYGEWTGRTQSGSSAIVRSAESAWPERGGFGLRATRVSTEAYLTKAVNHLLAAGETLYCGFWFRAVSLPSGQGGMIVRLPSSAAGGSLSFYVWAQNSGGTTQIAARCSTPTAFHGNFVNVNDPAEWHYVVAAVRRATGPSAADGWLRLYLDGALADAAANLDTYARQSDCTELQAGGEYGQAYLTWDVDEVKLATAYPEPFAATPEGELLSARRLCVLYRAASADSRAFARYCAAQLGVPRANLISLPAAADETLGSYAAFQSQVETPLADYFALNPTVAANCMGILLGHGVPGYFTHGGTRYSAASRLMRFGSAFSAGGAANPLYAPATVARLTLADLRAAGVYLATRIDADTLAHSQAVLDRSLAVSQILAVPSGDKLYCGDLSYRASLACQKLRIDAQPLPVPPAAYENDALVWGDTGTPAFAAPAGTRAVFADDSADSASTLRSVGAACPSAVLSGGYAAALGFSSVPDALDSAAFFEMLRIGGTFAEAACVAAGRLDSACVPAGLPTMAVAFPRAGWNIYRGTGGVENVDWSAPVACLRDGQLAAPVPQDLLPGRQYAYVARAVSAAGVEESNTHVVARVEVDGAGNLLPCPARPGDLTVDPGKPGTLVVGFSYRPGMEYAAADGFDVLSDGGSGQLDLEHPVAAVTVSSEDRSDFEVAVLRPSVAVLLAVRARKGTALGSLSETVRYVPSASPVPVEIF